MWDVNCNRKNKIKELKAAELKQILSCTVPWSLGTPTRPHGRWGGGPITLMPSQGPLEAHSCPSASDCQAFHPRDLCTGCLRAPPPPRPLPFAPHRSRLHLLARPSTGGVTPTPPSPVRLVLAAVSRHCPGPCAAAATARTPPCPALWLPCGLTPCALPARVTHSCRPEHDVMGHSSVPLSFSP